MTENGWSDKKKNMEAFMLISLKKGRDAWDKKRTHLVFDSMGPKIIILIGSHNRKII
jgi:hypothetical protein